IMLLELQFADMFGLASFAASYALLAAIPAPNFMVVAEAGFSTCRLSALMAAAGVATGAMVLAALISAGADPFYHLEAVRIGATLAFFAFTCWLGARAFSRALHETAVAPRPHHWAPHRLFLIGVATALCNPASAAFFA